MIDGQMERIAVFISNALAYDWQPCRVSLLYPSKETICTLLFRSIIIHPTNPFHMIITAPKSEWLLLISFIARRKPRLRDRFWDSYHHFFFFFSKIRLSNRKKKVSRIRLTEKNKRKFSELLTTSNRKNQGSLANYIVYIRTPACLPFPRAHTLHT